jgi:hypothetical protein
MTRLRLALAVAGVLITSAVSPAGARTWYVTADGTGDAPTIQAAIDSAADGDLIRVAPGTYDDTTHVQVGDSLEVVNVHLYKNVKLLAEGDPSNTTIGWSESDIAVYVSGVDSTAEIRGFRIETTFSPYGCVDGALAPMADLKVGIRCVSSYLTLAHNEIVNHGSAVELDQSPVTFRDNLMHHAELGISCDAGSDARIAYNTLHTCGQLVMCTNSAPEITDNEMSNACGAVICRTGGSAHVARNLITGMHTRAITVGEAAPLIEDNEFRNNSEGIFLSSLTQTPVVRQNLFYNTGFTAIELSDNPSAIIENNTIDITRDGQFGAITCQRGSNAIIRRNILTRVVKGILCLISSTPTIECNNLYDIQIPYAGDCTDQTGINGNISIDPQFCGIPDSGNYLLQADSPCAPGNHPDGYDCGLMGAKGVGCGNTPVSRATWGSLKAHVWKKEDSK